MKKLNLIVEQLTKTAILPTKAHLGDLGYDLYSDQAYAILPAQICLVSTGLRVAFPDGWGAKIFDRSSLASQNRIFVVAGVIDNGYRGEIKVVMYNASTDIYYVNANQKIAQLVPMQVVDFEITENIVDVEETKRKAGGFGSTGQ